MSISYFQCIGGASGDMILGALLDAGLALNDLQGALANLKVDGYSLSAQRAKRGGLEGTHMVVELDDSGRRTHTIQNFVDTVEASGAVRQRDTTVTSSLPENCRGRGKGTWH